MEKIKWKAHLGFIGLKIKKKTMEIRTLMNRNYAVNAGYFTVT